MKQTHVKIILAQPVYKSKILVDDKEIYATSIDIHATPDELLTARIETLVDEIIIEGEFIERKPKRPKLGPVPPSKKPGDELPWA
jgi:hypothetical protein